MITAEALEKETGWICELTFYLSHQSYLLPETISYASLLSDKGRRCSDLSLFLPDALKMGITFLSQFYWVLSRLHVVLVNLIFFFFLVDASPNILSLGNYDENSMSGLAGSQND